MSFHTPVLLKEAVDALNVRKNGKYIDATLGGGGHSEEIVKRGGLVLGIDQDIEALNYVQQNHAQLIQDKKLVIAHGNFRDIGKIALKNGFDKVDGVLFDLGVSSFQIDNAGRGFSFRRDEELDMRMDAGSGLTAYEVVNKWSQEELSDIFAKFGEEVKAQRISFAIVEARKEKEIKTSKELGELVSQVVGNIGEVHPATKTFQAIRIAVNSEMESLRQGLEEAFATLGPSGRMAVISFHSLEDRITKLYFLKLENLNLVSLVTKKPIVPEFSETKTNRRARSSKLRIIEKI